MNTLPAMTTFQAMAIAMSVRTNTFSMYSKGELRYAEKVLRRFGMTMLADEIRTVLR